MHFDTALAALRLRAAMGSLVLVFGACGLAAAATAAPLSDAANPPAAAPGASPAASGAGVVLAQREPSSDACNPREVTANPTRPAWDYAASSTQCGTAEVDSGWLEQPMGAGVSQWMLVSSLRYGLTPRLDLRWGFTGHINQTGGGTAPVEGIGDQWLSGRYRFVEQGRVLPAMALLYGVKVPTANPAKDFGTGFVDHQLIFIASRDLGPYHFDFNAVGTLAGGARGREGAAQFGLAVTRPINRKLSAILESYGGPQPGTPDRFGAVFAGATYALRPALVFDCAYTRTYTAGSPRAQVSIGITRALRPGFSPIPRGSSLARFLGR